MRATDVFTPAGVPTVTYVERAGKDYSKDLGDALRTGGMIASLSGPSKSGKTVLINKVINQDHLISISGAAIKSAESLWDRVLNWMEVPVAITKNSTHRFGAEVDARAGGSAKFLGTGVETEAGIGASYEHERGGERQYGRAGIDQVVNEIGGSDFVLFIDDFHYMPREIQSDVAKQLKEAAEKGIKICTASVPHRSDDVVRSNTELRGRVAAIDLGYWDIEETEQIAVRGFDALNVNIGADFTKRFAAEAFGSPQLMQQVCLQACFEFDIEGRFADPTPISPSNPQMSKVFERASSTTDFSSLLDALHAGPKQRGSERNNYRLSDGSEGDVYRSILLALKQDPPRLAFPYDELYQRVKGVCVAGSPVGSSIVQALEQIQSIGNDLQPNSPVLEYDENVLDIVDPYFLYYLRCSSRLNSLGKL